MGAVSGHNAAMPETPNIVILPPNPPSDPLVVMECELAGLSVEYGILKRAYPGEKRADDKARVAREMSRIQRRIAELQGAIIETEAETPAGAAVQLRRLQGMMGDLRPRPHSPVDMAEPHRLLASALAAIEAG